MDSLMDNSNEAKDNSVASNIENNLFSDSRLVVAAVFAFLPSFGVLGIHNFILKQYKKGIAHIAIVIVCYALYFITSEICIKNDCGGVTMYTFLLQYLVIASYIWAIIEGVNILQSRNKTSSRQLPDGNQSTVQDTDYLESSKSDFVFENVNNNKLDKFSQGAAMNTEQTKDQNRKVWSILSIIATVIPIVLWVYCYIASDGETSENGPGAVWWLVIMYYMSLGIPLMAVSIAFGIKGIKTKLCWLSIISLSLKAITITGIALLLSAMVLRSILLSN